jgi:Flp pilus assembly protein TadG
MRKYPKSRVVRRTGGAAVEAAICLPLVFILLMGSLEICNQIFLKESLCNAAYEAANVAARKDGSYATANSRVTSILSARGTKGYTLTITPTPESANKGTTLTVTVSASISSNSLLPVARFGTGTLSAQVTIVKEDT